MITEILKVVFLGIITLVFVIIGIYSAIILVRVNRMVGELEEVLHKAKAAWVPFQAFFGFLSGIGKIKNLFAGKCGKDKERRGI